MDNTTESLKRLKLITTAVYFCQLLAFMMAGIPLLVGVLINFMKRAEVAGTWLESHFEWQIKTAWLALAGFAVAGLTFEMGFGIFILIATVVLLVYRLIIGWNLLNADKPIGKVS